ncbi:MAG: hypothetical protein LBT53_00935 [Puniceicoccales bacterium]|jgi:hypothetical protein|nr:hypothetical protein [Puniceicoccales bacterium]
MPATLPENHALVPISADAVGQPLRICVVVHTDADPAAADFAPFVLLRSALDARVFLGAVADAAGNVREWLEIRVQTTVGLADVFQDDSGALSNRELDARWTAMCRDCAAADPAAAIQTGFENRHPRPVLINLDALAPHHPATPDGAPWMLATDDAELLANALPAYSSSQRRFLRADSADGTAPLFTALSPASPTSAENAVAPAALPFRAAPLNPEGGLLFIRRLAPFSIGDYAAFLGGRSWKGNASGRDRYIFDTVLRCLGDWDSVQQGGAHLFTTIGGRAGRFVETLHLKLSAFRQAVALVRAAVRESKLPFLNITDDSFRVGLSAPDSLLPALWTARLCLARSGEAIALPVKTADARYFKSLASPAASVWRPIGAGLPISGAGEVRVRRVFTDTGDRLCIEGTLVSNERVGHSASDILRLRFPLPGGRLADLFARLDTTEGFAAGEARFRTIPQDPEPVRDAALRAAEGAVFPGTSFETIPVLSTPADLFSLGVLATLLLTVNSRNPLGVAADDMLGFARRLAQDAATHPGEPLPQRAARLAEADPRIREALGAQRLTDDVLTHGEAFAWVPPELWWRILATIARYFPGVGPDSYCKDLGDASPFSPEKVFDLPLHDLDTLLAHTKSLVVADCSANREVARIIAKVNK